MHIQASCRLVYEAKDLTPVWLFILPAHNAHQRVLQEALHLSQSVNQREGQDPWGNRYLYLHLPPGIVEVNYKATVQLQPPSTGLGPMAFPTAYLEPSRYCCPLQVRSLAQELFGGRPVNLDLAYRLNEWVCQYLTYTPGSSTWETTATDTLLQKAGVCRDFAHTTIALARALDMPARYVSLYAPALQPPDFHACCELFVEGEWVRLDPTGLSQPDTTVLLALGRDAQDAPVANFAGEVNCLEQQVQAEVLDSASYPQSA
ncbi:transglutaminase family protein [Candidatus Cyanaurora vandensis]|uniref:transglutaminase-like domain-containing protein n=1 Tax=Candidatus Cyanaurora vandensis TaxID=2714958 RepID=UPI00257D28A4|nr:transglutaminase family protein [Candidatus Cyanaurora vandensis]